MQSINWLEFWYSALGSPFGIALAVTEQEPCRQALYRARTQAADPALDGLQVRLRPDGDLWIVKGAANASQRKRSA